MHFILNEEVKLLKKIQSSKFSKHPSAGLNNTLVKHIQHNATNISIFVLNLESIPTLNTNYLRQRIFEVLEF